MYQAIAVGTDGSPTAAEAVRRAGELARALDVPVHVISAYRPPSAVMGAPEAGLVAAPFVECLTALQEHAEDVVHRTVDALLADGFKAIGHVVAGPPAQAIIQTAEAEGAGLIVVGNKGMHGARRVLGSVPNAVSHAARGDVLIVHTT